MMDTVKVWTVGSFEHVEAQPEWEVRISQRSQSIVLLTPLRGASYCAGESNSATTYHWVRLILTS